MLIRTPASWSPVLVAVLAMVALAALDLVGAIAAKEAVSQRSPAAAAIGLASFVLLFWVFASSLQYAELAPVTFGWIVILQVGVLLVDHHRYGTRMPVGTWVAVAVIIAAQAYLLLGPGSTSTTAAQDQNRTVEKVPT